MIEGSCFVTSVIGLLLKGWWCGGGGGSISGSGGEKTGDLRFS